MTREELIEKFRAENPDITKNVASDTVLHGWAKTADKEICAITRCIVDLDGETISTTEDDTYIDLVDNIDKFMDVDEFPGGGVTYNGKRLTKTSLAKLDEDHPYWRDRDSGTPKEYFRRLNRIYFDRPIGEDEEDVIVYSVLISDDFDDDAKTPYNGLTYLEPFHDGINKYLQWRGKIKKGKPEDAKIAKQEYFDYATWMKKMITGGKTSAIYFQPKK